MESLRQTFGDRLQELDSYLALLDAIEQEVQAGPPRIGKDGPLITADQQKILYSSVFLQLYNLVESTITRCLDAVCTSASLDGQWLPGDLSDQLRREWVRFTAKTHVELNYDKRLNSAFDLVQRLVHSLPVSEFKVEKAGGNWDDSEIEGIAKRIGLSLRISQPTYSAIKRRIKNDKGSLALIRDLRNDLAHGSISFVECGNDVTVSELRDLKERTALYLREVVECFVGAIETYEFLLPERRPATGAEA